MIFSRFLKKTILCSLASFVLGYALMSFSFSDSSPLSSSEKSKRSSRSPKITKVLFKSENDLFTGKDLYSKTKYYKTIKSNNDFRKELLSLFKLLENPQNQFNVKTALQILIFNWVAHDPEEALASMETLFNMDLIAFELEYKYDLIFNVFYAWSKIEPEQAANYYERHVTTYNNNELLRAIIKGFTEKSPESAFKWLTQLKANELKVALPTFFMNLTPDNIREYIAQLPDIQWTADSDSFVIKMMASQIAEKDPDILDELLKKIPANYKHYIVPQKYAYTIKRGNFDVVLSDLEKTNRTTREANLRSVSTTLESVLSSFEESRHWLENLNKYDETLIETQYSLMEMFSRKYPQSMDNWIKTLPDGTLKKEMEAIKNGIPKN